VALALRLDLEVGRALAKLLNSETLGFYTKLEVELSALLKRFLASVSVTLYVLKKPVGGEAVRVEHVLNDLEAEDLFLKSGLVTKELLLLGRYLASDHGLATPLLLVGQLPVLEGLDASLQFVPLGKSLACSLLVESGLCEDDEGKELRSK